MGRGGVLLAFTTPFRTRLIHPRPRTQRIATRLAVSADSVPTISSRVGSSAMTESLLLSSQPPPPSNNFITVPASAFSSTHPDDWKRLCPPPSPSPSLWGWGTPSPPRPMDATILWTYGEDDPTHVATQLLQRLLLLGTEDDNRHDDLLQTIHDDHPHLIRTLAQSMTYFQDFCVENQLTIVPPPADVDCPCHHQDPSSSSGGGKGVQFKSRLVTTRGSQGTKCPLWHIDHVPVRWIQTMVGPGCQWVVGQEGVNWKMVMQDEDDKDHEQGEFVTLSVKDRNRAIVQDDVATIYEAKEQEAVLLLGNQWPTTYAKKHMVDAMETFRPALHKSPTIPWGCERVLLTQDVLLPHPHQHHPHVEGDS